MHFVTFLFATCLAIIFVVHPHLMTRPPTSYRPRFNITSDDLAISYEPYSSWVPHFTSMLSKTNKTYKQVIHGPSFERREKAGALVEEFIWRFALVVNDIKALETDAIEAIEQYSPGLTKNLDVEGSIWALIRAPHELVGKDRLVGRFRSLIRRSRPVVSQLKKCETIISNLETLVLASRMDLSKSRPGLLHLFFPDTTRASDIHAALDALVSATGTGIYGTWQLQDHLLNLVLVADKRVELTSRNCILIERLQLEQLDEVLDDSTEVATDAQLFEPDNDVLSAAVVLDICKMWTTCESVISCRLPGPPAEK
ncbi:hypothetical protein NM688_g2472 [Phlebia brevispora]|uniref:Uncharacterized protein n=1 Tax=Phlebia brevispora TaxID=194682 RepID=A0ACC1T8L6_9APHY|nr:hypothetical protein NM688_g2472 [Phlebia brevispora]